MLDYKNQIGRKYKSLEKEIDRCFQAAGKPKKKPLSISSIRKLVFIFCALLSGFLFFRFILSFASAPRKISSRNFAVSYIGEIKAKEEFDSMSNPDGIGGSEIKSFDTNSSELKFFFYKIKQGESLTTISKKLGMSMDTLISLNSMDNAHSLNEGQRIIVPNLQGILYTVKKGDTIESIAAKYKISNADILDANDIETDILEGDVLFLPGAQLTETERAKALGYIFLKPIFGRYTSGFGIRRDPFTGQPGYHPGIDISAAYGSQVKAAKEGRVIFTGWKGGYGNCIIIQHNFGYQTVYGHLSSIKVKENTYVKMGQFVGRVGSTGYSTGPHLHFEVRKYGRPTNPIRISGLMKAKGSFYR